MIPTVQGDLVIGNTRRVELLKIFPVQKVSVGGHAGSVLKMILGLEREN